MKQKDNKPYNAYSITFNLENLKKIVEQVGLDNFIQSGQEEFKQSTLTILKNETKHE